MKRPGEVEGPLKKRPHLELQPVMDLAAPNARPILERLYSFPPGTASSIINITRGSLLCLLLNPFLFGLTAELVADLVILSMNNLNTGDTLVGSTRSSAFVQFLATITRLSQSAQA